MSSEQDNQAGIELPNAAAPGFLKMLDGRVVASASSVANLVRTA